MNWIKMHWVSVAGVLGIAIPFLKPSIDAFIAANPHSTLAVLLAAIVSAYYVNSPRQQTLAKVIPIQGENKQ